MATGRGTPTLPSSDKLTADRTRRWPAQGHSASSSQGAHRSAKPVPGDIQASIRACRSTASAIRSRPFPIAVDANCLSDIEDEDLAITDVSEFGRIPIASTTLSARESSTTTSIFTLGRKSITYSSAAVKFSMSLLMTEPLDLGHGDPRTLTSCNASFTLRRVREGLDDRLDLLHAGDVPDPTGSASATAHRGRNSKAMPRGDELIILSCTGRVRARPSRQRPSSCSSIFNGITSSIGNSVCHSLVLSRPLFRCRKSCW